jgi:hypothetical protein
MNGQDGLALSWAGGGESPMATFPAQAQVVAWARGGTARERTVAAGLGFGPCGKLFSRPGLGAGRAAHSWAFGLK